MWFYARVSFLHALSCDGVRVKEVTRINSPPLFPSSSDSRHLFCLLRWPLNSQTLPRPLHHIKSRRSFSMRRRRRAQRGVDVTGLSGLIKRGGTKSPEERE